MAGRGPAPKPAAIRQRTNRKATAATLEAPTKLNTPKLPGDGWHELTVEWWQHVWKSPMAGEYLETDTDGLVRLAMLIDIFYNTPSAKVLGEIRLQEARFGLSPVDRARLQWEVAKGDEAERKRKPATAPKAKTSGDPRDVLRVVS